MIIKYFTAVVCNKIFYCIIVNVMPILQLKILILYHRLSLSKTTDTLQREPIWPKLPSWTTTCQHWGGSQKNYRGPRPLLTHSRNSSTDTDVWAAYFLAGTFLFEVLFFWLLWFIDCCLVVSFRAYVVHCLRVVKRYFPAAWLFNSNVLKCRLLNHEMRFDPCDPCDYYFLLGDMYASLKTAVSIWLFWFANRTMHCMACYNFICSCQARGRRNAKKHFKFKSKSLSQLEKCTVVSTCRRTPGECKFWFHLLLLVGVRIWPLTFWPQGKCMPRSCHGLYVYRLCCW